MMNSVPMVFCFIISGTRDFDRDGSSNLFGNQRNPQTKLGIEQYLAIAEQLSLKVELRGGYLFRPTNPHWAITRSCDLLAIINEPSSSSVA